MSHNSHRHTGTDGMMVRLIFTVLLFGLAAAAAQSPDECDSDMAIFLQSARQTSDPDNLGFVQGSQGRDTRVNPLDSVQATTVKTVDAVRAALPDDFLQGVDALKVKPRLQPAEIPCPRKTAKATDVIDSTSKYFAESDHGHCEAANGMWQSDMSAITLAKYNLVAELFSLRKGSRVLDWGAGCGHSLDRIAKDHGFTAVGVDLVPSNAKWAMANLGNLAAFCAADGSDLPFPNNFFDAVVSNAALYHISTKEEQCTVLKKQFLRVLRPGGCAWVGWNKGDDDNPVPKEFWSSDQCLGGHDGVAAVTTLAEKAGFGVTEHGTDAAYSIFLCKKA